MATFHDPDTDVNFRRSPQLMQPHNAWRDDMAPFFWAFKREKCSLGESCPKGINCMRWHTKDDRRRDPAGYDAAPCPAIYDWHGTKRFYHDKGCPRGEDCAFSHNYVELGFHPSAYKIDYCKYHKLCHVVQFNKVECPFDRKVSWFQRRFGAAHIRKIRHNVIHVYHKQFDVFCGQVCDCLKLNIWKLLYFLIIQDICCFWHSDVERRCINDPTMPSRQQEAQQPSQPGQVVLYQDQRSYAKPSAAYVVQEPQQPGQLVLYHDQKSVCRLTQANLNRLSSQHNEYTNLSEDEWSTRSCKSEVEPFVPGWRRFYPRQPPMSGWSRYGPIL